jgi:hypothetical protein
MPARVKPNASSKPATSSGKRSGALARAAPRRVSGAASGAGVVFVVSGAGVVVVFGTVWCGGGLA